MDEDDGHSTTDKNPSKEDHIQLAMGKNRKKLLRLDVWKHFTKLNSKFALCRHCQRVISYFSTTHSLARHLESVHPSVLPKEKNENDLEKTIEEAVRKSNVKTKGKHTLLQRKRRSIIWNYFLESPGKSDISCKVCKCKFSCHTSTSNLLMHRLRVHPHLKTNYLPAKKPRKPKNENGLDEINEDAGNGDGICKRFRGIPKNFSRMWEFFVQLSKETARCKKCHAVLRCKPTTFLYKHMRKEHPDTSLDLSAATENIVSDSESDSSDHPDNFDPLDYYLNANYKRQQNRQQTDSVVEDLESKTQTGIKLENDIPEKVLDADEEIDASYSTSLKESGVEDRIQIKEEIISEKEEEEIDAAGERLKEECAFLSEFKQVRLMDFLVPALNSEKYGNLLFWGHEPNVFFVKWRHKSTREFSDKDLAVFQDWDALKGRTKAESDDAVVNTRQRLLSALKTRVRILKSELKGYKKFQMLNTTNRIDRNELRKQNSVRKLKNVRRQKYPDLDYTNQRVKTEAESKDRFSRKRASISYKEASDQEEDGEEKEIPLKKPSPNCKTKSSPTKSSDKTSNEFSSKKNKKDNIECAKPIPKPMFRFSKATEPFPSSTKRSEDTDLITKSGGQKLKVKTKTEDKVKASPCQVPSLTSPKTEEDIKTEVHDTFTIVKTQGDMVVAMITTALPTLQRDQVSEVYNFLVDMGVENVEDLAFIEVEDLKKNFKACSVEKAYCGVEK